MKAPICTIILGLVPVCARAQTQPLRFGSLEESTEYSRKAAKRTDQNSEERKYWKEQETIQQDLASALSKKVNDSIDLVRTDLRNQAIAGTITPRKELEEQEKLDGKRAGITARIFPYAQRQAYCRYRSNNVTRLTPLPVRHRQEAPLYFNAASTRQSAEFLAKSLTVINPNTGKLSLYNELYGDYVGWWRVAFGTTLVGSNKGESKTPEDQKNEAALQRLLGGGGNALISATLPLASFHTDDEVVAFKLMMLNKIATDLPQNGAETSDFAYHSDIGFDFAGYYQGFNRIITPFAYVRVGQVWGNSLFYDNLGRNTHSGMLVGQIMGGLSITDVLQVAGTYYYGSAFIRDNFPFSISITLQPKVTVAAQ